MTPLIKQRIIALLFLFTFVVFSVVRFVYHMKHCWQLPEKYTQKPVLITGTVDTIPVSKFHGLTFRLYLKTIQDQPVSARLRLSWYHHPALLKIGERWQFWVRLKPPIGLHNPGGFDYSKWLANHDISATGYVISNRSAKKLTSASGYFIDRIRRYCQHKIDQSVAYQSVSAILAALSVGLRNHLTVSNWQVFQKTGTSHLVAISGLHIGLVAGVVFAVLQWFWRCFPRLLLLCPAVQAGRLGGLLGALGYTALSGFAVPAERALIMIICVMGFGFFYRAVPFYQRVLSALFIIAIIQPVTLLSASACLSFFAVCTLGYLLCARLQVGSGLREWGRLQLSLFIGLMPLSLWFFQQSSLISIAANVIAIPWIGFLVVPVVLLGICVLLCGGQWLSGLIFKLSGYLLIPLWWLLNWFSHICWSSFYHTIASLWILALLLLSLLLGLSPKGLPAKWLSCVGLLPLFFYYPERPKQGDYWIRMIDVGQGLSALIQTAHHTLLYDTGAHSPMGLDMGASVVLPFLRRLGFAHLDRMMISHSDNDHSGGAAAIFAAMPVGKVLSSAPKIVQQFHGVFCQAGQSWQWDGVHFSVLNPLRGQAYQDNNSSCVLRITSSAGSALLTGDIEHKQEVILAKRFKDKLHAYVLISPHHGSRTSSSMSFLKAVAPKVVLISLAAYNRYHFPSPEVIARYKQLGAQIYTTARNGEITIRFLHIGHVRLDAFRQFDR